MYLDGDKKEFICDVCVFYEKNPEMEKKL